jgi:hypothetical protein
MKTSAVIGIELIAAFVIGLGACGGSLPLFDEALSSTLSD